LSNLYIALMSINMETEAKIARIFLTIADGERRIDVTRQVLAEQLDFESYTVVQKDRQIQTGIYNEKRHH